MGMQIAIVVETSAFMISTSNDIIRGWIFVLIGIGLMLFFTATFAGTFVFLMYAHTWIGNFIERYGKITRPRQHKLLRLATYFVAAIFAATPLVLSTFILHSGFLHNGGNLIAQQHTFGEMT